MTTITFKICTSVNAYQLMLTDDIQKSKGIKKSVTVSPVTDFLINEDGFLSTKVIKVKHFHRNAQAIQHVFDSF